MTVLGTLTCAAFTPLVGGPLILHHHDGGVLEVTVASASEKPMSTPPDAPRTAFSVILTAPEPCPYASGFYTVAHPDLGPVGPVRITRIQPGSLADRRAFFQLIFN